MKPEDIERIKDLLPTSLGSDEIREQYAREILQRSVFSARMEHAHYLAKVREVCAEISAGTINQADARAQLMNVLSQMGHSPTDEGGLTNPASIRRLNLIIDTQRQMAASVAQMAQQNAGTVDQFPAWKLTRVEPRERPRTDWPQRWQAAGDACGWQGALKDEFVALKTSPIWKALGSGVGGFDDATDSDSPPFAINSGMGWIGVEFPYQQIVNSKSRIENNKERTMNEFKTKLFLLVARLSEESCQNILARIFQRIGENTLLPNEVTAVAKFSNKTWDESEHPRAEDGKFTNGPDANHGASPSQKKPRKPYGDKKLQEALEVEINPKQEQEEWRQYKDSGFLKKILGLSERPQYDDEGNFVPRGDISTNLWDKIPKSVRHRFDGSKAVAEIRKYLDEARKAEKRGDEGQTAREVLLEKLLKIEEGRISEDETWDGSTKPGWRSKPDEDGHFDHNGAFDLQWMVLDQLHELEKIDKKSSLNQKRISRHYEIQDEMDYIEEAYGDRERGVGLKWPDTQDAYEDRKRYRKLQRELKRLDRLINWDEVDDTVPAASSPRGADEKNNQLHPENPPLADRLADNKKRYPMLSKKEEEDPKGESVVDKFDLKVSKPRKQKTKTPSS